MGGYLPATESQRQQMLQAIGISSTDELFAVVPKELLLKNGPEIPDGMSELELSRKMEALAGKNTVFSSVFRGAGAYRHYIPSIVETVVSKETFLTAYTPYQPEISQGVLQSIFEYQTMICEITGMDVSNASLYDGASAAAEAVAMCVDKKRSKALVSEASHPDTIAVMKTYCWAAGIELEIISCKDGMTDFAVLKSKLDASVACVYIQQPNYFGMLENCDRISQSVHEAGAKFIMGVNPISEAIIKSAGEFGADIAVGEGQPLGMPLSFGGPYLGFIAATTALMRKLPGRIVGQTTDSDGRRAFVLTLQAREQHIRREKASSNICSNQALCAMTAAVYLAAMGPNGLKNAAKQCYSKAHYLAAELGKIGFTLKFEGDFFHEFVTEIPKSVDVNKILSALETKSILGGLPLDGGLLWCATELNTKKEIDQLIAVINGVIAEGGRK